MRKTTVGIFVFDEVEVLDFAGPYEVFSRTRLEPGLESRRSEDTAPYKVFTVGQSADRIVATGGLTVIPDYAFQETPSIDLLVVPGGLGTRSLLEDRTVIAWIQAQAAEVSQMASVCTGALLLATAGLLHGRRATTHWGALELLADLDDSIQIEGENRVVEDGIVTSAGVSAGIDMAFTLVERTFGRAVADETAHYMDYRRP